MVRSPEIWGDVLTCRNALNLRDNLRGNFKKEFEDYFTASNLGGKSLLGACEPCLDLHDAGDKSRFAPMLSQVK